MATSGSMVRLSRRPWFLLLVGFLAGLIVGLLLASGVISSGLFGSVWF